MYICHWHINNLWNNSSALSLTSHTLLCESHHHQHLKGWTTSEAYPQHLALVLVEPALLITLLDLIAIARQQYFSNLPSTIGSRGILEL